MPTPTASGTTPAIEKECLGIHISGNTHANWPLLPSSIQQNMTDKTKEDARQKLLLDSCLAGPSLFRQSYAEAVTNNVGKEAAYTTTSTRVPLRTGELRREGTWKQIHDFRKRL